MNKYKYNFTQVDPFSVVEQDGFTTSDSSLLESFEVNSSYNSTTDFIELHYYTLDGRLLKSFENYTNIQSPQDSETANQGTLSSIVLRTEDDLKVGGYEAGDVYLYYNFLSDPYSDDKSKVPFFIEEISPDRFELRLLTTKLDNEQVKKYTDAFKKFLDESDSENFYINLGNNRLLLATNIDTLPYEDFTSVVIKLYSTLPEDLTIKDQLYINKVVSNTVSYLAEAELISEQPKKKYIKGPNFSIEEGKTTSSPTQYFNIEEVFNYPVTNTYFEVKSLAEEKGIQLSIDYSDYDNFINFSSAEERLRNFKYKFDLIQSYESQSNNVNSINSFSTGSTEYFDELINNIISNFDHYDRFLYFESSSYSWPKSGVTKPYTPLTGSATGSWYTEQITSASAYDSSNPNLLTNTIPEFLREDPNNTKYITFVHMIAQHFDNLWIYAKGITDKYDADNRLDFGISKDLIEDTLKNFGVKLYNSNRSSQELFRMFTGDTYDTGSESYVDEIISGSNQVVSEENYRRQIYKRLYHNLPLLLKSKGTERGVRALLSTFGIPSFYSSGSHSGITINQTGGTNIQNYNLGGLAQVTSSLDKIRLDNTGSIEGTTLSQYVSIEQRDNKYTKDLNKVQVGYSPADFLDQYIIASASAEGFSIESILGDPDMAYSSSYTGLKAKALEYLTPTTGSRYDLKDFTRVLKFYDNIIFKTVNDFIPARDNLNAGIIIKPHLLERSKAKQVRPSIARHNEYSASIDIQTVTGSDGSVFGSRNQYSSSYIEYFMTSGGLASSEYHSHEQAKFDGELSGSLVTVSTGELNIQNTFKYAGFDSNKIGIVYLTGSAVAPTPTPTPTITVTPTITPTLTPTVTPTITPTPSTSAPGASTFDLTVEIAVAIGVPTTGVEYRVDGKVRGDLFSKSFTTGDTGASYVTAMILRNVEHINDIVDLTISRINPDNTVDDAADITCAETAPGDFDITPVSAEYTFSLGDVFLNKVFSLDNFDTGKSAITVQLNLVEG